MGPMANPHNLAPPGTVFVHGTTQDYGDRGSNMPHLKLQLRALGLLDTGLKPQLIARLQLSDAGQSPTTDWTAFDGRDSTDLDAGARVYSALDLPAAVAVLQTSPAFATSFGAEPAVLTAHVPALGAPDDAIALRLLHLFAADKDLNAAGPGAAAVPVAGPPGGGVGPAVAGMSDDALFRDREAETLLFLLEHPEQPGLAELTTSGAGDTLSRKAGLHLRLSLRKGAFVVADWVKETVAKVQPAAAATSTGAGLLPAAQAQQVTQIMQQVTNSGGAQLKAEFEVKLKAEMAKMQEEVAASHEVGEQIQLGMQSIAGTHRGNACAEQASQRDGRRDEPTEENDDGDAPGDEDRASAGGNARSVRRQEVGVRDAQQVHLCERPTFRGGLRHLGSRTQVHRRGGGGFRQGEQATRRGAEGQVALGTGLAPKQPVRGTRLIRRAIWSCRLGATGRGARRRPTIWRISVRGAIRWAAAERAIWGSAGGRPIRRELRSRRCSGRRGVLGCAREHAVRGSSG